MPRILRAFAGVAAGLALSVGAVSTAGAAGAIAIGTCAAYGYAFDFGDADAAQAEAVRKCAGKDCKVVVNLRKTCGAFAIDARKPCGPHGFASARRLAQAQNQAMKACYHYGGRDCVIRAFACDGKG